MAVFKQNLRLFDFTASVFLCLLNMKSQISLFFFITLVCSHPSGIILEDNFLAKILTGE